jgi:hypothetical protein
MVQFKGSRFGWLLRVIHKPLTLIILRFSHVARLNSVWILLTVAVNTDWSIFQLDVKNAFLYGGLEEEVYVQQPPRFVTKGECQKVCRLKKAIYGLK